MSALKPLVAELPVFDRKFWDGTFRCTQMVLAHWVVRPAD